jgi:Ca2+-binding EF-hand superfamily protein
MGNAQVRGYIKKVDKALQENNSYLERETWKQIFMKYDKEGKGYITHKHVNNFIREVFKTFPTSPPASEEEIADTANCFQAILDNNNDGKVTLNEFTTNIHDVYRKFRIEQIKIEDIQTEYNKRIQEEKRQQEERRLYEEKMYLILKEATENMRNEKTPEAVAQFLKHSKWNGTLMLKDLREKYEVVIEDTCVEECTFTGYHVIGSSKDNITGEFKVKMDWLLVELGFKDSCAQFEAKFSLRDDVPSLNGPCSNVNDLASTGAFSMKYHGVVSEGSEQETVV